jgi:predicted secreted protein
MKRFLSMLLILALINSCKSYRHHAFEYEIVIKSNNSPVVPKKFISYRDLLFMFNFDRVDSTFINYRNDSVSARTRFDSTQRWIFNATDSRGWRIDKFNKDFVVLEKSDLIKFMEVETQGGYVFDKELYDTIINGVRFFATDSIVQSKTDSIDFRYYFLANSKLNTVYSMLNMKHVKPQYKYAGFTMDDYKSKYFFYNLITNFKEVNDSETLQKLEAIYQRFKRLQKSE